ncbi:MAG: hypothetical protein PUD34_05910 [bacterium]|nr:hypothetical protein [bacterium]
MQNYKTYLTKIKLDEKEYTIYVIAEDEIKAKELILDSLSKTIYHNTKSSNIEINIKEFNKNDC